MNFAKKVFSGFVSLTTIAWSVTAGALALPNAASAATLMQGDLIKASGPAVYYYAADQKRYVFPNEKTYFSWFRDFSSVKTISDAEMAAILIGGNATMRPGTKLVKITTDPKVYAVTLGGMLHWVQSEAVATSLYGSGWASRVVDVPDAFFVNYSVGAPVSTPVHPDGSLIKYAGDSTMYVVWGGMKRRVVSESVWASNGFDMSNVVETTIAYPNGTDVSSRECQLADVIALCSGTTTPVGGNVTVSLASDTPAGVTVPRNASSVMLAKYNFMAGTNAATITGLRIRRIGVGATSDLSNVYLYDGNGTRLTTGRTINSSTQTVEFNNLNISVPAGQTKSLVLVGDFNVAASVTGGQHSFELSDAASVVISGTGATVSGSFPVRGNVFTVGTTQAGRLDVQKGTTPTNPNIGAADAEIANFKLTANTNDIEVRRVTLLQAGDVSNSDLSNFTLYQGSTVVATAAATSGDKIVLNFNPPYLITNGTTRTFSLHAKIAGRANRTIKTYVEYTTDVYAIDRLYNSGASVCIANSACGITPGFDGSGTDYSLVTTQGGQLTVAFNGPTTSNVAKGSQDTVLFKFSLTSPDNALEIRKLNFRVESTDGGSVYNGTTEFLRDIKVKNLDTGATVAGPQAITTSSTSANFSLSDSFNIQAGQTMNLAITTDLANSTDAVFVNHMYRACLTNSTCSAGSIFGSSDVRIVDTGEFLDTSKIVPNSFIAGNVLTVKASSLSVALAATPVSATAVKKQQMIPSVGLVFTAGAQSDVMVRSVILTGRGNTAGTYTLAAFKDVVTSCALFDGDTQVGLSRAPDTTTGQMNITNINLTIPRGTSKTLVAKCTADSTVAQAGGDLYSVGIAADADVTADDSDSNTIVADVNAATEGNAGATPSLVQTVKNGGVVTLQPESMRQSTIVVADGSTWQNLAQFKATAQFEAAQIERLVVTSTGEAANFGKVAVVVGGTVMNGPAADPGDSLSGGNSVFKDVDLTTNPVIVPKDGSVTFQLWAKLNPVQSSSSVSGATTGVARSGASVKLGLAYNIQTGEYDANYANKFNVRFIGQASGDRLYADSAANVVGNTFVVRKAKPVVTRQVPSTTTLSNGAPQDLYRMQIASEGPSIAVKRIVWEFSKSGNTVLSNFRIRKGTSEFAAADASITDGTGAFNLYSGNIAAATTTGRVIVTFTNEETITGSGAVYTLAATPSSSAPGDNVSFTPARDLTQAVVTGYLQDGLVALNGTNLYGGNGTVSGNLDTGAAPSAGVATNPGTFVWSDNSEVPHSSLDGNNAGSRDWTNDVYVDDLTQSQSLTR